jgi:hypothetical protein
MCKIIIPFTINIVKNYSLLALKAKTCHKQLVWFFVIDAYTWSKNRLEQIINLFEWKIFHVLSITGFCPNSIFLSSYHVKILRLVFRYSFYRSNCAGRMIIILLHLGNIYHFFLGQINLIDRIVWVNLCSCFQIWVSSSTNHK